MHSSRNTAVDEWNFGPSTVRTYLAHGDCVSRGVRGHSCAALQVRQLGSFCLLFTALSRVFPLTSTHLHASFGDPLPLQSHRMRSTVVQFWRARKANSPRAVGVMYPMANRRAEPPECSLRVASRTSSNDHKTQ